MVQSHQYSYRTKLGNRETVALLEYTERHSKGSQFQPSRAAQEMESSQRIKFSQALSELPASPPSQTWTWNSTPRKYVLLYYVFIRIFFLSQQQRRHQDRNRMLILNGFHSKICFSKSFRWCQNLNEKMFWIHPSPLIMYYYSFCKRLFSLVFEIISHFVNRTVLELFLILTLTKYWNHRCRVPCFICNNSIPLTGCMVSTYLLTHTLTYRITY